MGLQDDRGARRERRTAVVAARVDVGRDAADAERAVARGGDSEVERRAVDTAACFLIRIGLYDAERYRPERVHNCVALNEIDAVRGRVGADERVQEALEAACVG